MTEGLIEIKVLKTELLTGGIVTSVEMNYQQNRVNDSWVLSDAVIDWLHAWLFMFIDAIVYLFGP